MEQVSVSEKLVLVYGSICVQNKRKANWLNVANAAHLQHLSGEMRCSFLAAVLLQQGNLGKSRALCIVLTLVKKPALGTNRHSMKALLEKGIPMALQSNLMTTH